MVADHQIPESFREILEHASHRSLSKRRSAFERFLALSDSEQPEVALMLLALSDKDVLEAVLEHCTREVVSTDNWRHCLENKLQDANLSQNPDWNQAVLVILQRYEGEYEPSFSAFCEKQLDSDDADVRYQAYCLSEMRNAEGEAYLARVRRWIEDKDEDFRIVSIQALARLKPDWAMEVLKDRASKSFGLEAFHVLLTQIRLCLDSQRGEFVAKLIPYVRDERYSFAAIQALSEYGNADAIPALLGVASRFWAEPTIRVAAAGAAAKLGSEKGRKILLKFATSGHGNPKYAEQLLDALDGKDQQPSV